MWSDQLSHNECRPGVDVHYFVIVSHTQCLNGAIDQDAGTVNKNINGFEVFQGLGDHRFTLVFMSKVMAQSDYIPEQRMK